MLYNCAFIGIILITIILMVAIKHFDKKSLQNRERVRRHRHKNKIKSIYENEVQKYLINAKKRNDEENPEQNSDYEHNTNTDCNADGDHIFVDKLRNWSMNNRVTAKAMTELLGILRFAGFNFLPKDSRTIMQTPKNLNIKDLENGRMWYNGVAKCLENICLEHTLNSVLTLDWNFDGLPVFKSSNVQFWPMLASIQGNIFSYW